MKAVGLFAGIGGLELAFERNGFETTLLCENRPAAQAVLSERFPHAQLQADVRDLTFLPKGTDIVYAGFPCQDLSSSGLKSGINGTKSSLVGEMIRLISKHPPEWLVLENVRFMLHLQKGEAMNTIVSALEHLGYSWAYRVINTLAFGLPQRRHRVFIVASLNHDPRMALFADDTDGSIVEESPTPPERPTGFYWTEGAYATGLADNAIPPLKGGSGLGIPSAPAIFLPNGTIGTPQMRDAERLQGFPAGWTDSAEKAEKPSMRWQLVGNAVSVPVAEWLSRRIVSAMQDTELLIGPGAPISGKWPNAAANVDGRRLAYPLSEAPIACSRVGLDDFLTAPLKPLSLRAAKGFLKRARSGRLRYPNGFLESIQSYATEVA